MAAAALLCCLLAADADAEGSADAAPQAAPAAAVPRVVRIFDPAMRPVLDRPMPRLHTGRGVDQTLNQPISASWRNFGLRSILRKFADEWKIAILLDRRIDPSIGQTVVG
jgi:hypothetical protein